MKELGPIGGMDPLGGHGPPMWALFTKNVCENERIGSHRGCGPVGARGPLMWVLFTKNACENKRIGSHGGHVLDTPTPRSANDFDQALKAFHRTHH